MRHMNDNATEVHADETPGGQVWDAILRIYANWVNAALAGDDVAAAREEQELRFFSLFYLSFPPDAAVTTGRKAIIRSMYAEIGGIETAHVKAMLNLVIEREEAAARQGASRPGPA